MTLQPGGLADMDPDLGIVNELRSSSAPVDLQTVRADPNCVKIIDRSGRVLFMSRNGMRSMAIDAHKMVEGKIWADLWPEKMQPVVRGAVEKALTGTPAQFTGWCPTAAGEPKLWDVTVKPVFDLGGTVTKLIGSSRDITVETAD